MGDVQTKAFEDFTAWQKARHPDRDDYYDLAKEYAQDCECGSWQSGPDTSKTSNR